MKAVCEWVEKALENTASSAGRDYEGYIDNEKTLQDLVANKDANEGQTTI